MESSLSASWESFAKSWIDQTVENWLARGYSPLIEKYDTQKWFLMLEEYWANFKTSLLLYL